ncbi:MAG: hypothetical protein ACRDBH_09775 [Bosea sp. (in: a-proteobacteria)]
MPILDLVQYVFMAMCGPAALFVLLRALPLSGLQSWSLGLFLTSWFALTALMPLPRFGPFPGALFGILLPVIVMSVLLVFHPVARRVIAGANVPLLVSLHITRLAGGLFILLEAEGRLSNPFAAIAGWGDIIAATLAIPAAFMAWRGRQGWEAWVLAWNVIGFVDFISAVGLGITSQPGSPLRLFFEVPGTAILGELPWRFIPNFFVPLYIVIHVALFVRLVPVVFARRSASQHALS